MDLGSYYSGKVISSALFNLWISEGVLSQLGLKLASSAGLLGAAIAVLGGYIHYHLNLISSKFVNKYKSISTHHLFIFMGLGLGSWSGHILHISLPSITLILSGLTVNQIPFPHDLLFISSMSKLFPGFSGSALVDFSIYSPYASKFSLFSLSIDPLTGSIPLVQILAHHFYLSITALIASVWVLGLKLNAPRRLLSIDIAALTPNLTLTISLVLFSSGSMLFAHHSYALPSYPFLPLDYCSLFSLYCHHINLGSLLALGAGTHASIYFIRDYYTSLSIKGFLTEIISHRCLIVGHLIYVSIFLGLHAFGIYIHNDTIQSLGRPSDMFSDNSIQLKPVFALWIQSLGLINIDINLLNFKISSMTQELGTADYMVQHIIFTHLISMLQF
jgi:photosystem I P700 chlorophyll a apoprotein A1